MIDLALSFLSGGHVVHSYGRLIPKELPITDLQQLSGPDGIGRINCTFSSGTAWFKLQGDPPTGGEIEIRNGTLASLTVNATDTNSFRNIEGFCIEKSIFFYVFLSAKSKCCINDAFINLIMANYALTFGPQYNNHCMYTLLVCITFCHDAVEKMHILT